MIHQGQRGQSCIETVIALPTLILACSALSGVIFLAVALTLTHHAVDECLLCSTHLPRQRCENELRMFLDRTKIARLQSEIRWLGPTDKPTMTISIRGPLGVSFEVRRQLHRYLTDNIKTASPLSL